MSGFAGCLMAGGGAVVSLAPLTIPALASDPQDAFCAYELQSDGDVQTFINLSNNDAGDWISPTGLAPGTYECRATLQSGTSPSGTLNTWLALTSNRSWSLTRTTVGTVSCVILVEIRLGSTVLASANITLEATVE